MKNPKVPVIMYHSVGIQDDRWQWKFLTCPYQDFENQLKWIKRTGYTTLNFQELYNYIIKDIPIPKKSVFLTFDDGYLDNYVFVYPLLKRYGMKGTIFVNPDFVDKSNGLRKTMGEVNTKEEIEKLDRVGFCNWDELRKIDAEGILDVQSHAKTHDWYPISDKIIDFRHPKDEFIWMDWNEYPEEKPYLQYINREKVKLGSAVFEHEKALSSKRVFINDEFQKKLQEFVKENGEKQFFSSPNWRDQLFEFSIKLKENIPVLIRRETQSQYLERIKFELEYTKNEIEKQLTKEVNFLCWPGGSATTEGVKIADSLGYLMSTAAKDIPKLRGIIKNTSAYKINRISRFTPIMYDNTYTKRKNSKVRYSPGWFFILDLMRFQNKYYAGFWVKAIKYLIMKVKRFV